jgi:serine/threonine protein kinase/HAMP domain-containing protein
MADPESDLPTRQLRGSSSPTAADPDATVIRDPSFWQRGRDPDATVVRGAPVQAPTTPALPPLARHAPLALPAGFVLHEYRIERVLGQGGFGITYLARDTHLNAPVAIKEYLPEEIAFRSGDASVSPNASRHRDRYRQGLDNFVVEARTLATFRHRAIVRVARYFEAHHTAYMVLEYERGQPLRQWWPQHAALGEAGLVERLVPLLQGLETVHEAGYLHRDIKPDNIQVREDDSSFVLLDFGSAQQTVALADQDAVVLTPGYAPIEQYGIGEQGPWTDIYAFGATLYWAVSGSRPPDAEQRAAGIHPQPAVQAGQGRFGAAFLQAIDWALEFDATRRPRSIADWRAALLADHLGSIGLAEALQRNDTSSPAEQGREQAVPARLAALAQALLDPRRWPLAWKFSVAFVATALVPMLAVSSWNLADSLRALEAAQLRKSELMAHGVADRLSQLMADLTHLNRVLAADADVGDWLATPDQAVSERLRRKLEALDHADPDVSRVTVIDVAGAVQASSVPASGAAFSHPELLNAVQAGRPHVSSLSTGQPPSTAGLMLVEPLRDRQGTVKGAVVLDVVASAITEVLDAMRQGAQLTPFLIDGDGVIVHHPDPDRLHRSLAPLSAAQQDAVAAERRFGRDRIHSLGEADLARAMVGARQSGHVAYRSSASGVDEIAGFAPVQGQAWVVGLAEPRAVFEAPLQALYQRLYGTLLLVGLLVAGLGLVMARSLVRPIRALTDGARALEGGDFDGAKVSVRAGDEVGQLARTFNVMVEVLQQRERDRSSR